MIVLRIALEVQSVAIVFVPALLATALTLGIRACFLLAAIQRAIWINLTT